MGCICLDITILQKMESEGAGEHFVEQADGSGHVVWTSAMSAYMLSNLASLVVEGIRTSTGFKKVHLNMCAKALNDYFKMKLTGEQVKNHLSILLLYFSILLLHDTGFSTYATDSAGRFALTKLLLLHAGSQI